MLAVGLTTTTLGFFNVFSLQAAMNPARSAITVVLPRHARQKQKYHTSLTLKASSLPGSFDYAQHLIF